jgi:TonB family protein
MSDGDDERPRPTQWPLERVRGVAGALVCIAVAARANEANANPPFINMLYPPAGMTAPREDPARPHALPAYPPHAAACKETGEVKLQFTIGPDGTVSDVQIVSSSGYADLDASAVLTAQHWRYVPATKAGAPVAVEIATSLDFPPEERTPKFDADCTAAGMQAAVDAVQHGQ